ncbi:NAD(P)H-dependent oxidoreductase, partial [Candidatus Woesearchaeota archaeon]|nr:NAD(P)H-dependent oxidoreductase [Candidatus Woesearchaeota archaeon]
MNFKEIVMSRYATKKFNGEKIPQDKVDELIELIRYSASSFNMQTWKLKIISDPKMLADLKPVSFNQ